VAVVDFDPGAHQTLKAGHVHNDVAGDADAVVVISIGLEWTGVRKGTEF
jgi:hypothetical protein